jgi:hypothetical protein
VSVGVRWTSVGLSAAVRSFLVEFDCWFGESPTDSPAGKSVGLTSPTSMHRKVTGKSPDNSSHSRAKKLAFWIGRVRRSPTGVRPEKGGECKDLVFYVIRDSRGEERLKTIEERRTAGAEHGLNFEFGNAPFNVNLSEFWSRQHIFCWQR